MAFIERNNLATKPNISRKRKFENIKVEEKFNKDQLSFAKRKQGLFNKVTELSVLCQAKTALIITSKDKKIYACGYPNVDTVIRHFLDGQQNPVDGEKQMMQEEEESVENLRVQYEALQDQLKEEKKNLQVITEAQKNGSCFHSWWNDSIDDMNLESLEMFKTSLENLKLNLLLSLDEKRIRSSSSTIRNQIIGL
ncbi:agamous-like MADS-box protein AGL62 [Cicer arietinum]|uniref:Agamous-like MADS-box protein AGL62 n=1 Tax=Cicer arietinum TaxID=3827 RepID=A0A1S2Z2Q1_CICAR|nr:agamous-like MADS-box protein AGL62 [Cicer arietinum]